MSYSSSKVTARKKMYKMNMATPVSLFIRQPHADIVVTTISNMANSSTIEQNIPWLFTMYAFPPDVMLYSNHGNGSLEITASASENMCSCNIKKNICS